MIAELGATAGIFPSDERTREWLEAQERPDDFGSCRPTRALTTTSASTSSWTSWSR
jgi:aconitase A